MKHPAPYRLQWIGDYGEARVTHQARVPLQIGEIHDEVLCDVVPMDACHVLLGRPWEFDAIHDGYTNQYTFTLRE